MKTRHPVTRGCSFHFVSPVPRDTFPSSLAPPSGNPSRPKTANPPGFSRQVGVLRQGCKNFAEEETETAPARPGYGTGRLTVRGTEHLNS